MWILIVTRGLNTQPQPLRPWRYSFAAPWCVWPTPFEFDWSTLPVMASHGRLKRNSNDDRFRSVD